MLTTVEAYKNDVLALRLHFQETDTGRPDTDLIQGRDIQGLDPVKASVNTSPYGSVDGASYVGSSVETRNIVLTLSSNPDWDEWTHETLRRQIYSYFMPKRAVRLRFRSTHMPTVDISGIVESVTVNQFSKDPEVQVSIICPDPYFMAIEETVLTGIVDYRSEYMDIEYEGTADTGFLLTVSDSGVPAATDVRVGIGDSDHLGISPGGWVRISGYPGELVSPSSRYEMSSIRLDKFVRRADVDLDTSTNLLPYADDYYLAWPIFEPGNNILSILTDSDGHNWEVRYFARFGGM